MGVKSHRQQSIHRLASVLAIKHLASTTTRSRRQMTCKPARSQDVSETCTVCWWTAAAAYRPCEAMDVLAKKAQGELSAGSSARAIVAAHGELSAASGMEPQ
ncbi:unnamed protein product [Urochloa humidicola]